MKIFSAGTETVETLVEIQSAQRRGHAKEHSPFNPSSRSIREAGRIALPIFFRL